MVLAGIQITYPAKTNNELRIAVASSVQYTMGYSWSQIQDELSSISN
jgi:hypothetical protein